jgi:hypothetical protein
MSGLRGLGMFTQALIMRKEMDIPPRPLLMQTRIKSDMILQNRQVTIVEVAHQLQISHGSVYEIIRNSLTVH